jgi:hypothetical protein
MSENRLYIPNFQLNEVNELLKILPTKYRKYTGISNYKKKVYSPGLIRMKLNDRSIGIGGFRSDTHILHKYFRVLEEKQLGCNLLMSLMCGIAHNFMDNDNETIQILQALIEADY